MRKFTIGQFNKWGVQQALDRLIEFIGTNIDGKVKVTANDTQSDFVDNKLVAGQGLTRTVLNPGAVEQYRLDALSAEHELIVDPGGNFDDTSISAAVSTAIAEGASESDPWLVTVKPGTYTEPPMTIPAGVSVVSEANRIDTAIVNASSASSDLFTMTGGYLAGLKLSGVTDSAHALVRCSTPNTLAVLHGVSLRNCSNGVLVENGASCIVTNSSITIDGPGQAVENGFVCRDAGSYLGITGLFLSVPAAVLPLYPGVNPIQVGVYASGSKVRVTSMSSIVSYNVADNSAVFADDGADVALFSADIEQSYYGARIGATGANTSIVVQGASFLNNDINGQCDSATGIFQVSAKASTLRFNAVAGAKLNGLIQLSTSGETLIAGDSEYYYSTGRQVNFGEILHDFSATGSTFGSGEVTDAGGLDVDVAAGEGYVTRHAPDHDTQTVTWDAATITLTDDATCYVYYDFDTDSITHATSSPGADKILLATVLTLSGDIIYLHDTRQDVHQPTQSIFDYLLETRRIAWNSGLAVSAGSGATNLDVSSGSWYRAWELLSVAGGSDITWAYYYGSGAGLTRVAGVSAVDINQWDNAGVLANWTGSNKFKADTLIVTSDNRFTMIYGTQEFNTQAEAEDVANKAAIPNFLDPTGCHVALIVSGSGAAYPGTQSVVSYVDIRPDPNAATSGGTGGGGGTTDHSALSNLNADDHTQYLRTDGTRVLTGSQNFGGNNATNVGTVNGVTVEGHAARHKGGGADEIDAATTLTNGLMSATDKTKLDAIPAPSYAEIYLSAPTTQGGLSGTPTIVTIMDTNGVASGSSADQANNRCVAGADGDYRIHFHATFDTGDTTTWEVNVNGTPLPNVSSQCDPTIFGSSEGNASASGLVALSALDVVTLELSKTGGATLSIQNCVLSIERIG